MPKVYIEQEEVGLLEDINQSVTGVEPVITKCYSKAIVFENEKIEIAEKEAEVWIDEVLRPSGHNGFMVSGSELVEKEYES